MQNQAESGRNRDKMKIIINLTQSTYHQTLNIGKILRKSGQNRGKIRAKSGQIGPKPDFLGFKPKIQSKFGANWPFAPNSEHCPDFRDD